MRDRLAWILMVNLVLFISQVLRAAEVQPTSVQLKEQNWWVGQQIPFTVQLRANGSFSGAASFTLPELSRVIIMKTGSPVVSSEEIEGKSWFVQSHEFALFSQRSGEVEIPAFEVRFSHRDGFTGPSHDQTAQVPGFTVNVERPQGSSENNFLVTTSSLKITESWDPKPGDSVQGAVFRRTIQQTAEQVSGMALAPPPEGVPEGIRIYLSRPQVTDRIERGDFIGSRSDTITYQMQQPGNWTLPAIQYQWWDPQTKQFGTKTLPAVSFQVKSTKTSQAKPSSEEKAGNSLYTWGLLLILLGLVYWQQGRFRAVLNHVWQHWHTPERMATRALLSACHKNDTQGAEQAWQQWQNTQPLGVPISDELRAEVLMLQQAVYGVDSSAYWQGEQLAGVFQQHLRSTKQGTHERASELPVLNP